MKVIFVHHSCFVVEMEDVVLIFDYFEGNRVTGYTFTGVLPVFDKDKSIYFFASHKHQDHFDMNILNWQRIMKTFILFCQKIQK